MLKIFPYSFISTINIEKNFSLNDMNFKNLGKTDQSKIKNTLKKVFNDI
ncbi:MAG: hypothetical protein CM15mP122_5710 [Bacteroidota bacterium]|nr:MAG: hypothetical protein CM15mP122_5710 [Bacteroidota bacterium]